MPNLRVDPAGLTGFAATCTRRAVVLRTALATGAAGPSFESSALAVRASDSMVTTASNAIADRIDDLSARLSAAASHYVASDAL